MPYFVARLREPSTLAGLSALMALFGIHLAPEVLTPLTQIIAGCAALAAVFMPESK